MSDLNDSLRSELRDPEYSEGYAESFLNSYVATQLKVIREQRQMKQSDLAKEMGTTQTAISRIENVNYTAWNIKTLKKAARALRVRLRVSFETYGSLPEEVETFGRETLQRAAREEDPGLLERVTPRREELEIAGQAMAAAMGAGATNFNLSSGQNLVVMPRHVSQQSAIAELGGGLSGTQSSYNG
ncbi:MAG TPA: helix-turn-helix transcriptional regulator [Candidatus Sulfotelmatobacter sp.]|jgi:transcriptional regulator with XRE-family HTH domain|nr:helix-turn-helix transcriptional regulator [Candidatus Sulfotelmatobacter sp.]